MAAPRLQFLWPMLFRPLKPNEAIPHFRLDKGHSPRHFSSCPPHTHPVRQRYGPAREPEPHLREQAAQNVQDTAKANTDTQKPPVKGPLEEEEEEEPPPIIYSTPDRPTTTTSETLDEAMPVSAAPDPPLTGDSKPLDTVLHMPSPAEEESRRPPHLKTPPYVHHFDSYSLVKQLTKGGYAPEQAVTIMKAVRGILTENIELARQSLVSKSNVENETYLFRAACSELRIEVQNSRKSEMEKMRTERNQLQHEVDILNQRLGQETGALKDELKGLFDDRKMAVRNEQRAMDSKIQELNYKITVALNSDARSEVEALRWVLTRRAAITIGVSAFMLFLALRYSTYVHHNQQEEKKKAQKRQPPEQAQDNTAASPPPAPPSGQEASGGELLASTGGVSLG
ncbi:uncharacterized protein EI97DRAFT_131757 [Westerdykella ornata]|uniref:DUF1640-domain-containing protein n=1 Tax=Westerdykella ornata TaxID=318751 RepID=A0A6A6JDC5_WESOR|nr:uncharacterized protein EI97DRAFT_131757 [Westerdykella ornata]KAF2274234.1 hypothetical protein EI97DRAFT_131757 [Westerdykella ornata]